MNYDGKRRDLQSFSRKLTPEDSPSLLNLDGAVTNTSEPEEAEQRKSPGESPNKLSSSNEPRRLTVSIFEATNLELKLKLRKTSLKPEKAFTQKGSFSPENNSSSIQDEDILISPQNIPADDSTTTPAAKISLGSENDSKAEGANYPRVSVVQDNPSPRSSLPQRVSQISNHSKPSVQNLKHDSNTLDESGYVLRLSTVQRSQSLITENNQLSSTASDETHATVGKKQSSTESARDEAQTHENKLDERAIDAAIIGKNKFSTESAGDESVKTLKNQHEERATDVAITGRNKWSTESADDKGVKALENQPEKRFTEVATEPGIPIPKSALLTPTDNPRLSTFSNTDSGTVVVGNNPAIQHRPSENTASTLVYTENRTLELEQLENPDMATSKPLNPSESLPFKSQAGSKVECDCSPCECELPIPPARNSKPQTVPPGYSKYECDCSPCECTSIGPSQSVSAEIIDSNLALQDCHCSPCECTLPSTGDLRKTIMKPDSHKIDHTECNCSPCECSYPPSSIVSEAGIVRAPSPIPAACQVQPSNFCNAPCSQMPTPMLRMQSEQVSAAPMLQSDQCQTYPPQFPYQTFQQQRPNNLPSYCFPSQFPNQQFLPNCQNPCSPQGHFQLDNGAPPLVCPPEGNNNAQWLLLNNFNTSGQYNNGVYPTPVGFAENQCNQLPTSPPVAYRNSWVNRIPFAPKPEDHRASFMLAANHFGNMNPFKMNAELRDCSEQTEGGKDASSYCSSTRRRKSSSVKVVTNGCQDTKSPELVLVREVYHFKKASKAQCCGSRKTLSNATSSLCCRPRWTNAYKYQCNPYLSKVRPPRPPTPGPCPVCKGCDCICSDDQQSSPCSQTGSKHHQTSRSCLSNGCCEKVPKKASCGCDLVKVPKGPVSLVREFLIQGNGLPLHLQGLCGVQQSPPSLQQQQQPVSEVKGQSPANSSTNGQTSKGNERKSNALLTVSRVPVVVEEDFKRISHGSISRRASQRRSTIQRKKSIRNSKDSASVENKANNNQLSPENNEQNVHKVEHETQNVMESNEGDATETETEPKVEMVAAEDTNDEGPHKKRRKRKGDKGDDDEPDSPTLKQTLEDHADELDDTPWRSNDLDEFQEPESELDDEPPKEEFDNVRSQFFDT